MLTSLTKRKSLSKPSPLEMVLIYTVLIFWTIVVLFPLYWVFITSFKLPIDVNTGPFYIPFVDFKPNLHAWEYILVGDLSNDTIRNYINTVIVAPISAALALLLGTSAAYALTRFNYRPSLGSIVIFLFSLALVILAVAVRIPWQIAAAAGAAVFVLLVQTIAKRFKRFLGNRDIAFWMISQRMLPPVAVVLPIYILFQRMALLNTRSALIITYVIVNLPIVIWLMRDYFLTIPVEVEECAQIDGASRYRILWSIVLPLSVPGLVATFLFVLVFAWNEYLLALFLSGADSQTLPLTVAAQNATRGPQWWYMSVLILIMIIPVIVMAILLERYIARGLLVGAVKG